MGNVSSLRFILHVSCMHSHTLHKPNPFKHQIRIIKTSILKLQGTQSCFYQTAHSLDGLYRIVGNFGGIKSSFAKWLSLILVEYKFGDVNAQHHRHIGGLSAVTFEKFAKLKTLPRFPTIW